MCCSEAGGGVATAQSYTRHPLAPSPAEWRFHARGGASRVRASARAVPFTERSGQHGGVEAGGDFGRWWGAVSGVLRREPEDEAVAGDVAATAQGTGAPPTPSPLQTAIITSHTVDRFGRFGSSLVVSVGDPVLLGTETGTATSVSCSVGRRTAGPRRACGTRFTLYEQRAVWPIRVASAIASCAANPTLAPWPGGRHADLGRSVSDVRSRRAADVVHRRTASSAS